MISDVILEGHPDPHASVDVASILKLLDKLRYSHPAAPNALFTQQLRNGRHFVAITVVYHDPLLLVTAKNHLQIHT